MSKTKSQMRKRTAHLPSPRKNNNIIIIKQYKANSNSNDNNNKWYIKHNHYNLRSIKKNLCKSDCHVKIESVKNIEGISEVTVLMKGRVHSKLKMLASFTHTHVFPNLYDFLYDQHQKEMLSRMFKLIVFMKWKYIVALGQLSSFNHLKKHHKCPYNSCTGYSLLMSCDKFVNF